MQYKHLTDHKKSIMLFLVTFILYALVYMTKNCYSAAMASIVDAGIMTKSQTGLIAAVFYLVYAPFQIVGGIAADKHSPLKLITIGVVGAGIANLLIYLFNSNYIAMMVIWACNAVVQFGVWPSVFRIIATQLAEEHRSKAIVYISLSSVSGLLLSYLMAVFITEWQYNFLYSSIILFCIAVVFVVVYKYLEKDMVICEITLPEKSEKNEKASEKEFSTFRLIIVSGLPLMFVVYIVQNVLNLGIKALAPVMFMEAYSGVSPAIANGLNTALILATPVGLFLSRIPFFRRFSAPKAVALLLAISLPMLFAITFVGSINLVFVIASLMLLMVDTGIMTVFFSYMSSSFEKFGCVATVSGLFNCMASLGIVLANYVFAKFADMYGWGFTTKGWVIITVGSLILTLIAIPVWERFIKKMKIDE